MKNIPLVAVLTVLALVGPAPSRVFAADEDGVALAIVYDTSGSMKDPVRDATGKLTPKHVIAKRALEAILKRLQAFMAGASADAPRKLHAGLYAFSGDGARELVRLAPFDPKNTERWIRNLPQPASGTPLGNALKAASQALFNSGLSRKHVLVITDGMNTVGPDPVRVMPGLKDQAARQHANFSVHFVAFDVDAKIFDPLKKLGVSVLGAANEAQLNSQLGFILEKKILLEEEEPPARAKTN